MSARAGLAAAVLLACVLVMSASSAASTAHRRAPTTWLGPDGVVSRAMVAENAKAGTTAWEISSAPMTGSIAGFANTAAAHQGTTVGLYVSTTAPTFTVTAYRMGYYHGAGARRIWTSRSIAGHVQPACPVTAPVNMVSCTNWALSIAVPITSAFVPGDYLLKLVGSQGQASYVLLTVWNPKSTATYLVVARSMTEQGWNAYGGYSFYQGSGPCTFGTTVASYPVCNRARIVSFDRPYDTGDGASDFLSNEYPLVRFAEQHGLDTTYVSDVTIDAHPSVVLHHRAILSLGHDETWTETERQAVEAAMAHGINVVYFGAAAVLRHARLQASSLGPDQEVVNYRDPQEDPLGANPDESTGNTFSSPPTDQSPIPMTGETYSGFIPAGGPSQPFVVADGSSWLFKKTGLHTGSSIPGVIESDVDHWAFSPLTPRNLQILGHSPIPIDDIYTNQGTWGSDSYADTAYFDDEASHAGVFDTGTVNWIDMLTPCFPAKVCVAPVMRRMTGNLLRLFGQGPAGLIAPSRSSLATIKPLGS